MIFFAHKSEVEPLIGPFYRYPCYVSGPGNISVALRSMPGQKALGFHQKYLHLCSYGFGTTWGCAINDTFLLLEWTIPLSK